MKLGNKGGLQEEGPELDTKGCMILRGREEGESIVGEGNSVSEEKNNRVLALGTTGFL